MNHVSAVWLVMKLKVQRNAMFGATMFGIDRTHSRQVRGENRSRHTNLSRGITPRDNLTHCCYRVYKLYVCAG
jgi:hypothetical protein